MDAVELVDPAGQAYPAEQFPMHADAVRPPTDPKRPVSHRPLHDATLMPGSEPYRPALQLVQTPAPPTLYVPTGQTIAVALLEAAGQAYPAVQGPLQAAVGSPVVPPYRPALQLLHDPDPDTLYVPRPHTAAVADTDPDSQ
jgi:hypothetical protein